MRYNFNDPILDLRPIELKGQLVMFTDYHISRSTLPKGVYCYSIRHDDEGLGDPVLLENNVCVNHFGDVISLQSFTEIENNDSLFSYIELEPGDIVYRNELKISLSDYLVGDFKPYQVSSIKLS